MKSLHRALSTRRRRRRPFDPIDLADVRSRIAELPANSSPLLVYEMHVELLVAFGRRIGFDFHPQRPSEPPDEELIAVFGWFDRNAPRREFGLQIYPDRSAAGTTVRVAWIIELYLPECCRREGAGTVVMDALIMLWKRMGLDEVRVTTVGDGQYAFPSWGFEPDPQRRRDDGLLPLRLTLSRDWQAAHGGSTGA